MMPSTSRLLQRCVVVILAATTPCLAAQPLLVDRSPADSLQSVVAHLSDSLQGGVLPTGTTVDEAAWTGNVLYIYLTAPAGDSHCCLSDLEIEGIAAALAAPFKEDSAFGGTVIRVRSEADRPYTSLEAWRLPEVIAAPQPDASSPSEMVVPAEIPVEKPLPRPAEQRGSVAQAARQPTGALSGVTVYASAGHGWTAGDSAWYLQRPVLHDMCEDYGNVDMLNHFVHFAYNAGATVVPFRPVGWQTIEIVLDNDDPGVTYNGTWTASGGAKYYENGVTTTGVAYQWTTASATESATARFTPTITTTDFYPVYCFTIAGTNRTRQTYRVGHSGGVTEITINHKEVGNGWIWLGNYFLEAGGDNYVEVTNESPDSGVTVVDAMRWGGGVGDIVRSGPGSISGYSRDEEAQRYWAHSELGNNASGFSSDIWDGGGDDGGDNVRCGGKWAREMNQVPSGGIMVDRWKRVHLEFHTNAFAGTTRGQICLITDLGATTYQSTYANVLSNEVDADMLVADADFEHQWVDRSSATYTSSYGAIATGANSDEFDATIVELAFHDNPTDAQLLRDSRVRAAMARACVHGIIRFLNTLPDSEVPLSFAPDTPRYLRVTDDGGGDVTISWEAPLSDGARGDPATGYVVYQSTNGYGFGSPIILGDVRSTTVSGVPVGETRYFRMAATNAGGESMPSEVLAVRRPDTGTADVLIVNGFDRLRRQINPVQTFTQPAGYAGDSIERQIWRQSNAYDYIVEHADALAANGYGFASCDNESVEDAYLPLNDYGVAVWISGTESTEDATFNSTEQLRLTAFLENGGSLFMSGSEIGYDLVEQGNGVTFLQDTLRTGFSLDDAGTFDATGAGGILSDIGTFDFDPANGAPYLVAAPDALATRTNSVAVLNYLGGSGGIAGVQYDDCLYRTVTFGFPFETITSAATRSAIMQRVMEFLSNAPGPLPFDQDRDCDVDLDDYLFVAWCMAGPDNTYTPGHFCLAADGDGDNDVDFEDYDLFQRTFTGPTP